MSLRAPEVVPDQRTCRSCGAAVVFRRNTRTGKRQILDVEPHPSGRVLIMAGGLCQVMSNAELATWAEQGITAELVRDHHATCPAVDQWR